MRRAGRAGIGIVLGAALAGAACGDAGLNARDPARSDGGPSIGGPADGPARVEVGNVTLDAACVSQTVKAERAPLDLYIMLDASYSMFEETAQGMTKWDAIKAAISAFLVDPRSAGLAVGLQVFPLVRSQIPEDCFMDGMCGQFGPCLLAKACSPATRVELCRSDADCGGMGRTCVPLGTCSASDRDCLMPGYYCGEGPMGTPAGNTCQQIPGYCQLRDICESSAYATPTVPITPLPAGAGSLMAALGQRKPEGLTPAGPALAGAIEHARARLRANPARSVAVVFASDGHPSACTPATVPGVAAIAADGAAGQGGAPAVLTFAIGVVSRQDMDTTGRNLGAIATAGGTKRPFVINTAADVAREFQGALDEIRATQLACELKLPAPAPGQGALDYSRVNVQLTAGDGSTHTIPNVADRAACDPARGGWYYDVNPPAATPAAIVTCPATCQRFRDEPQGKVDVVLGCLTVVD